MKTLITLSLIVVCGCTAIPPNSGAYICVPLMYISSIPSEKTDSIDLVMYPITSDIYDEIAREKAREEEELTRAQAVISFREESGLLDRTGFVMYSTQDPTSLYSTSAYLNKLKREVLVIGTKNTRALRITGIPIEYGSIVEAGWYDHDTFVICTDLAPDNGRKCEDYRTLSGFHIYCDLNKKEVALVDHWFMK